MQVDVVQVDPDFLGVPDTFVAKPAKVLLTSSWVIEANSVARHYRNYRYDVSIVHVVVDWHKSTDRATARCGLVAYGRYGFRMHERPWAFREERYGTHVEIPRFGPLKWHRLCSRCVS